MNYRSVILYTLLFLSADVTFSQYYQTGQDPAALKWVQIKTDRFRVIYPEKYGSQGIAFARSLNDASARLRSLFPERKIRIPVIIHSYTTSSNGYVAWAPSRMEIYPTPEQNTIPLDPMKQLSIHELAHVMQMSSLNKGFTRGMSFLLGEQVYGAVAFLLPLWFLEGDAVFAESALTGSGRGRSPAFLKQFKAIAVEKDEIYKYDKIVGGSYRDFVPNHYESGYQMVTWALAKNNPQVWNNMLNYTAKFPFTINPVNISLTKNTGLRKMDLYTEAFDSLKIMWTKEVMVSGAFSYPQINPAKGGKYLNYYSPVVAGTEGIIAVKTSLSEPPAFVLIEPDSKKEKKILIPGQIYPWFISYGNGSLVWVETRNDPRWANREYSIIKLLNIKSKRVRVVSRKSRYLCAAISPDGKIIAAGQNSVDNQNSLILIDTETGRVMKTIPSPGNAYIQHPQWSDGGDNITIISLTQEGEGVINYNLSANKWEKLIMEGKNDLQSALLRNDSLFFISSVSGTDNIYLMTPDRKISGITRSRFGAADLTVGNNRLYFSDYTSSGNNICSLSLPVSVITPDTLTGTASFLINRFNIKPDIADSASTGQYTPRPYRKILHLFRFHSWMPFYADIQQIKSDPASIRPGVTLMTQNNLTSLVSTAGYEYTQDKRNVVHTRITWQGWYPVLESDLDYGNKPVIAKFGENVEDPSGVKPGISFTNTLSVPLNFTPGRFNQYFNPSISSEYMNDWIYLKESNSYDYGQNLITGRLYFSNYQNLAYRDIIPRWAQTIDLSWVFAPFDSKIYGSELSLRTALYFPGFLPNNGIRFRFERERQDPQIFYLNSKISLPRGYSNIISEDISFVSGDYIAPLFYPDINLGSFLYFKRLRTSIFYDFARGTRNSYYASTAAGLKKVDYHDYSENFSSTGIELMADINVLRIPYAMSCGVQSAWTRGTGIPVFRFLLNFDLFGMVINKARL